MDRTYFKRKINRLRRRIANFFWQRDQNTRKAKLRRLSKGQLEGIRQALTKDSQKSVSGCLLTISFGSRQLDNRDNLLDRFCQSFLAMTENPKLIEIIIKIDDDDDLLFYDQIKKKYQGKIHLRFIVSPRGRGYADMHIWHANAFKASSPSSLALFILTEDSEFCYEAWDTKLISMIKAHPDNYFIAAPNTLTRVIKKEGPNPAKPVPVYWLIGVEFPIIGREVLKCTQRAAEHYPDCTCWGNLLLIDSFSGDILKGLWERYRINLLIEVPDFALRKGVFSWTDCPRRSNLRNTALLEFFKPEHQKIRDDMVDEIYRAYTARTLQAIRPGQVSVS